MIQMQQGNIPIKYLQNQKNWLINITNYLPSSPTKINPIDKPTGYSQLGIIKLLFLGGYRHMRNL